MKTFRDLDGDISHCSEKRSSLDVWYDRVRDIPLDKLEVEDLCKACRQELFLENIVPLATKCLQQDPNAGERYDGELASAVAGISIEFWRRNPELANSVILILGNSIQLLDGDVVEKVEAFFKEARRQP